MEVMDILLITLILYMLALFLYFRFRINWILLPTILLWLVPIFTLDNLLIIVFCVVMIIITIAIALFNGEKEEY
jgi:hypothetical protein